MNAIKYVGLHPMLHLSTPGAPTSNQLYDTDYEFHPTTDGMYCVPKNGQEDPFMLPYGYIITRFHRTRQLPADDVGETTTRNHQPKESKHARKA